MKEISKVLVWMLCLSLIPIVSVRATVVDDYLLVPMTVEVPEIDGERDDVWNTVTDTHMRIFIVEGDTVLPDFLDLSASYRMMWDAEGIYFFGHVLDSEVDGTSTTSHENDSWEIYFDAENLKNDGSYVTGNDVQWRYVYGKTEYEAGFKDDGECAWLETDQGYDFELFIPVDSLVGFVPEADHEIGWDAQVNDRDNAMRETMIKWWDATNDSWFNPAGWGQAMFTDQEVSSVLNIYMADSAPEIDGEMDGFDDHPD